MLKHCTVKTRMFFLHEVNVSPQTVLILLWILELWHKAISGCISVPCQMKYNTLSFSGASNLRWKLHWCCRHKRWRWRYTGNHGRFDLHTHVHVCVRLQIQASTSLLWSKFSSSLSEGNRGSRERPPPPHFPSSPHYPPFINVAHIAQKVKRFLRVMLMGME